MPIECHGDFFLNDEDIPIGIYLKRLADVIGCQPTFSFLQTKNFSIRISDDDGGTAYRKRVFSTVNPQHEFVDDFIFINSRFLRYAISIITTAVATPRMRYIERAEALVWLLRGLDELQSYTLRPDGPRMSQLDWIDYDLLTSILKMRSSSAEIAGQYFSEHPLRYMELCRLFIVFLVFHEIGHIIWPEIGANHALFFKIDQIILQDHDPVARFLKQPEKRIEWYSDSIKEEIFCDALAIAACFECMLPDSIDPKDIIMPTISREQIRSNLQRKADIRGNQFQQLGPEIMSMAMRLFADIINFLARHDALTLAEICDDDINLTYEALNKRTILVARMFERLVTESHLWPEYYVNTPKVIGHVSSTTDEMMRYWSIGILGDVLLMNKRNQQRHKLLKCTLHDDAINTLAIENELPDNCLRSAMLIAVDRKQVFPSWSIEQEAAAKAAEIACILNFIRGPAMKDILIDDKALSYGFPSSTTIVLEVLAIHDLVLKGQFYAAEQVAYRLAFDLKEHHRRGSIYGFPYRDTESVVHRKFLEMERIHAWIMGVRDSYEEAARASQRLMQETKAAVSGYLVDAQDASYFLWRAAVQHGTPERAEAAFAFTSRELEAAMAAGGHSVEAGLRLRAGELAAVLALDFGATHAADGTDLRLEARKHLETLLHDHCTGASGANTGLRKRAQKLLHRLSELAGDERSYAGQAGSVNLERDGLPGGEKAATGSA